MADLAISQELNPALVLGEPGYADVTRKVSGIVEGRMPRVWYIAIACTGTLTLVFAAMLTYVAFTGIGVWGNNSPVGWAWDITNFVFWIGIGHAGTLISAILFLFRQRWRTSINRFAEAMTLFAVACAGIFPVFHTGRPWRAVYWLFPMPNPALHIWQNFRSPLHVGRFRREHLRHGLAAVLVHRPGARPGHVARPCQNARTQGCFRPSEPRLARLRAPLEALRAGLSPAGRHLDAAGAFGPHHRQLRLRGLRHPRLAHHHLPALLRRGRHLLRASPWWSR